MIGRSMYLILGMLILTSLVVLADDEEFIDSYDYSFSEGLNLLSYSYSDSMLFLEFEGQPDSYVLDLIIQSEGYLVYRGTQEMTSLAFEVPLLLQSGSYGMHVRVTDSSGSVQYEDYDLPFIVADGVQPPFELLNMTVNDGILIVTVNESFDGTLFVNSGTRFFDVVQHNASFVYNVTDSNERFLTLMSIKYHDMYYRINQTIELNPSFSLIRVEEDIINFDLVIRLTFDCRVSVSDDLTLVLTDEFFDEVTRVTEPFRCFDELKTVDVVMDGALFVNASLPGPYKVSLLKVGSASYHNVHKTVAYSLDVFENSVQESPSISDESSDSGSGGGSGGGGGSGFSQAIDSIIDAISDLFDGENTTQTTSLDVETQGPVGDSSGRLEPILTQQSTYDEPVVITDSYSQIPLFLALFALFSVVLIVGYKIITRK